MSTFFINLCERSKIDFGRVIIDTIKTNIISAVLEFEKNSTNKIIKKNFLSKGISIPRISIFYARRFRFRIFRESDIMHYKNTS